MSRHFRPANKKTCIHWSAEAADGRETMWTGDNDDDVVVVVVVVVHEDEGERDLPQTREKTRGRG